MTFRDAFGSQHCWWNLPDTVGSLCGRPGLLVAFWMEAPKYIDSPHKYILDILYYATRVCRKPPPGGRSLAETICSPGPWQAEGGDSLSKPLARLAPTTVASLIALCSNDAFATRPLCMPKLDDECGPEFFTAWHKGLKALQPLSDVFDFCPISTVEWDNTMLRWNRDGVPLCQSKDSCAGLNIVGAPGPLHVYQCPPCTSTAAFSSKFCLLCIRQDMEGLVLASEAKYGLSGRVPCVRPPFKNIVECPGGYKLSACYITPSSQSVFLGGIYVVSSSPQLEARLDTKSNTLYVDQSPLIYTSHSSKSSPCL